MEQHLELESLGILRQTKVPQELAWMSDAQKAFVLDLLFAGAEGMHKRDVSKFEKKNPDVIFTLTVRDLANWESDKLGKPTFLVLTWKGEEVAQLLLQIAKHENKKASSPDKSRG